MSATSRRNKKKAGKQYAQAAQLVTWDGERKWLPKDFGPRFVLDIDRSDFPRDEEIPDFFKTCRDPFSAFIRRWFYAGTTIDALHAKVGIDRRLALRHLLLAVGSFQFSHEHKIAGSAYLMAQWFDLAEA